jgi:hypothetical protein
MHTTLACHLICESDSAHLLQLYAGFAELTRQHRITVTAEKARSYRGSLYSPPLLRVIVDGRRHVVYDTSDDHQLAASVNLDAVDLYFKRSYRGAYLRGLPNGHKVRPLGLNYAVYSPSDFLYRRALWSGRLSDMLSHSLRANRRLSSWLNLHTSVATSHIGMYEGWPRLNHDPRILFVTQCWPLDRSRDARHRSDRDDINQARAACVRALRREFRSRFVGGIIPDAYARREFPDVLLADGAASHKRRYLAAMHDSDICVATAGLQGSNGWKLGEYVAAAKAIVTERLRNEVPGGFRSEDNYLEFSTPDGCVQAAARLVDDPALRWQMMVNNMRYYAQYLRPDMLIWQSLSAVVELDAMALTFLQMSAASPVPVAG